MKAFLLLLLAVVCLVLVSCPDAGAATPNQIATYNAAAPALASCPNVTPILVDDLPGDAVGQMGGDWGPCAFAIVASQTPYAACLTVFHEREHLHQFEATGRTWHDGAGLMAAEQDADFYFEPCARLVPPALTYDDAKQAIYANRYIATLRCTRRGPAAFRCVARTYGGTRRIYSIWRGQDRRVQVVRLGRHA